MLLRWTTLLVLTYVVLDFANPFMPGAVQVVDESLEIVAGYQTRGAEAPGPVRMVLPGTLSLVVPQPVPTAAPDRVIRGVHLFGPQFVRVPPKLSSRSAASSSSDDA